MTTYHTSNPFRSFGSSLLLLYFSLLLPALHLSAQTAIGGNTPDPSTMLDVQGTSKGVLFPRMTASQRNAIVSPATGLMIYNTDINSLEINLGTPASPSWQVIIRRGCGAYVLTGVWKVFSCYNLGAANTSVDPFTPSWEIIGGYWQWGRSAQAAPGPTGTGGSTPNDGDPSTWTPTGTAWNTTRAADGAWVDGNPMTASPADNPCPAGFRVPSKTQWEGVKDNTLNPQSNVGSSWSDNPLNYATGKNFGPALFLPAAGGRDYFNGTLFSRGSNGYYWSSTEDGTANAWDLDFNSGGAYVLNDFRTYGFSVRCVAE
jgi:uncharacterized protein (TIGR02145 family)